MKGSHHHFRHATARLSIALGLRWYRATEGLSVAQAAKRARVPSTVVAALEDPDQAPTLAQIEKVAVALGLRLEVSLKAA